MSSENQDKNREHYNRLYKPQQVRNILHWIDNLDHFIKSATTTEASWFAIYKDGFKDQLRGKKVLEMGCGDCTNAAVMAALGAEVYANDIADSSGKIIRLLNESFQFDFPIRFIPGDFIENDLERQQFDYIIGKAFLHHLELPLEEKFLVETSQLLKPGGEARFFEPAVNMRLLDEIRWYIPVGNRPSKFQKKRFKIWKQNDPHPERTFSSSHFFKVGKKFFKEIEIYPVGTLERFSRFYKWGENKNRYKKWALEAEKQIPKKINLSLTRSQLIIYKKPY